MNSFINRFSLQFFLLLTAAVLLLSSCEQKSSVHCMGTFTNTRGPLGEEHRGLEIVKSALQFPTTWLLHFIYEEEGLAKYSYFGGKQTQY